jgi:hypothetical protein
MALFFQHIPIATAKVLQILAKEKFIKNFTLVGRSALALQLGHRQSEDLDFIFDDIPENSLDVHLNLKYTVSKQQIADYFKEQLKIMYG